MPVARMSRLFGRTLREAPADADSANHQLLVRSGLIVQLAAGVYSFLPPAWRVLRKIEQIIREEMEAASSQEMRMPAIQPRELWEESGRADSYGPVLFNLKDRRDRTMVLAPTHEESVTDLFRKVVQSYRDLPQSVFQMQTKFRDEPRPRGGLVRVREFIMKDAYTFDVDDDAFQLNYLAMRQAYYNVFERCGVPVVAVQADSGAIGGKQSEEFIFLTEIGEDNIVLCSSCGYAANQERAEFARGPSEGSDGPLEEVATPGITTIDGLAQFLDVSARATAKAAFFLIDGQPTFAVIRGDLEVNELKLINALDAQEARPLLPAEVAEAGWVAGYASPIDVDPAQVIADPSVTDAGGLVAGANREGAHLHNVTYGRDWNAATVADIAMAQSGDTCAQCNVGELDMQRGIELGHIFKLGTRYADPMEATFLDADGERRTPIMGCYGIGVERLMAAVVQSNHDQHGIIWPRSVAPYDVHIVPLGGSDDVASAVAEVEAGLSQAGCQVLTDDRQERAGVKFNDADLLGAPLRITIGARGLKQGQVELKLRRDAEPSSIPLGEAVSAAQEALTSLDR